MCLWRFRIRNTEDRCQKIWIGSSWFAEKSVFVPRGAGKDLPYKPGGDWSPQCQVWEWKAGRSNPARYSKVRVREVNMVKNSYTIFLSVKMFTERGQKCHPWLRPRPWCFWCIYYLHCSHDAVNFSYRTAPPPLPPPTSICIPPEQ